eukprot:3783078-Pleurochrysis_carterae.AAC.1
MAALDKAIRPRSRWGFDLLVRCVTRRIGALVAVARRRRFWAVVVAHLFGDKGSALRSIRLYVAADLACLVVAEHFADGNE